MQTVLNVPLRFGDPVVSLAQNSSFTAYGTAFGKVDIVHLNTEEVQTITEISEEYIASIYLSQAGTLTYSVGDFYVYQLEFPFLKTKSISQSYSRIHTMEDCSNSLTFLHDSISCLVPTNGSNIYLLDVSDRSCKLQNPLPPNSIPLGFYKDMILIEQFSSSGSRQFLHFFFEKGISEVIFEISQKSHISHLKILKTGICFIEDNKHLNVYHYLSEYFETIFTCFHEIVTFAVFEENDCVWGVVVDCNGGVCVFKDWKEVVTGEVHYQGEVIQDFEQGYPYYSAICPPFVSLSSDHFVHILKFS
jgi:hypothetical protein